MADPLDQGAAVGAETKIQCGILGDDEGRRTCPERSECEQACSFTVGQRETGDGVGNGGTGVGLELELAEGNKLARLGAAGSGDAATPEIGENRRDGNDDDSGGRGGNSSSPFAPGRVRIHRCAECLLDLGQPAGVALTPQLELAEGGAGPEPVVVASVLVPGAGGSGAARRGAGRPPDPGSASGRGAASWRAGTRG